MSCRSSGGRAFHTLGPAAEKLLSPKLLWVRGPTQVLSLADRTDVVRCQRQAERYQCLHHVFGMSSLSALPSTFQSL